MKDKPIPEIIIFDIDGTLTKQWSTDLLHHRQEGLDQLHSTGKRIYLASNQGGPAFHTWHTIRNSGRANEYPSLLKIVDRIESVMQQTKAIHAYLALHPGDQDVAIDLFEKLHVKEDDVLSFKEGKIKASYQWGWRKPEGSMLEALILDEALNKEQCVYVGNDTKDFIAARTASIAFIDSTEFFYEKIKTWST